MYVCCALFTDATSLVWSVTRSGGVFILRRGDRFSFKHTRTQLGRTFLANMIG